MPGSGTTVAVNESEIVLNSVWPLVTMTVWTVPGKSVSCVVNWPIQLLVTPPFVIVPMAPSWTAVPVDPSLINRNGEPLETMHDCPLPNTVLAQFVPFVGADGVNSAVRTKSSPGVVGKVMNASPPEDGKRTKLWISPGVAMPRAVPEL